MSIKKIVTIHVTLEKNRSYFIICSSNIFQHDSHNFHKTVEKMITVRRHCKIVKVAGNDRSVGLHLPGINIEDRSFSLIASLEI